MSRGFASSIASMTTGTILTTAAHESRAHADRDFFLPSSGNLVQAIEEVECNRVNSAK